MGLMSDDMHKVHGTLRTENMRKIRTVDFNLMGRVRGVITERSGRVVQDLRFDTDGLLLRENFGIHTTVNPEGIVTDTQSVLPDAGWALDNVGIAIGTFVAVGTYGGSIACTTYDPRGLPFKTVFSNAQGSETASIQFTNGLKGTSYLNDLRAIVSGVF